MSEWTPKGAVDRRYEAAFRECERAINAWTRGEASRREAFQAIEAEIAKARRAIGPDDSVTRAVDRALIEGTPV